MHLYDYLIQVLQLAREVARHKNLACFWWYHGLQALMMGSPREFMLYLVDNTGSLPSVSPLNNHMLNFERGNTENHRNK